MLELSVFAIAGQHLARCWLESLHSASQKSFDLLLQVLLLLLLLLFLALVEGTCLQHQHVSSKSLHLCDHAGADDVLLCHGSHQSLLYALAWQLALVPGMLLTFRACLAEPAPGCAWQQAEQAPVAVARCCLLAIEYADVVHVLCSVPWSAVHVQSKAETYSAMRRMSSKCVHQHVC